MYFIFFKNYHTSLLIQMVKNLLVMKETRVQSLVQEDHLEKGMTTHSSILAWRIPWTEEPSKPYTVHGGYKVLDMTKRLTHTLYVNCY